MQPFIPKRKAVFFKVSQCAVSALFISRNTNQGNKTLAPELCDCVQLCCWRHLSLISWPCAQSPGSDRKNAGVQEAGIRGKGWRTSEQTGNKG